MMRLHLSHLSTTSIITLKSSNKIWSTIITGSLTMGLLVVIIALFAAGCTGSKSLGKKGDQLMDAGLYTDAADFYYNALLRNNTNVDARIGLAKAGQRVLDGKLANFTKKRMAEAHEDAVYAYLDAMQYREKVASTGVNLNAPDYLARDFNEAKELVVKKLYDKGVDEMGNRQFSQAERTFAEIMKLEPGYKDVKDMVRIAINEPRYLAAVDLLDRRLFRQAYVDFNRIYAEAPDYKDVARLRAECLERGQFPVAIASFSNSTNQRGLEKRVQAFVVSDLTATNDPFLKVIERDNTDLILKEQRLSLSGNVDQNTAVQVGNLLGAKAIVSGQIISHSTKPGRLQYNEKSGFESYQVKLYNSAEDRNYFETRYRPVTYREYFNNNEVSMTFQYKAISLETGAVIFSRVVEKRETSNVYYATYDGEVTRLFPANENGILTSNRDRQRLQELIRSNREIKTIEQLTNEACKAFADDLSAELTAEIQKL